MKNTKQALKAFFGAVLFFGGMYLAAFWYAWFWAYNFDKPTTVNPYTPTVQEVGVHNFPKPLVVKTAQPASYKVVAYRFTLNRISAYTTSANETDATPYNTSCGHVNDVKYKPIIAVSRDIFFYKGRKWLCGKTARIEYSDGTIVEGVIYDTMNARYRNTADILIRKTTLKLAKSTAYKHGVKVGKLLVYSK